MINVLYIGNNLRSKQTNTTSIAILGPLLETEGYKLYYASHRKNKFLRLLDMVFKTIRKSFKVDVVLIDTYSTQNFYYALIVSQLCRFLKLKYISILRGGDLESRLKQSSKWSSLIFNHARVNVAPSLFIKSVFESYGYSKLVHVPNTIKIENYPFKERSLKTIKLLWVRSFSRIYNPQLAVKILKLLQEKGHDATLCMVGPDTGDGSLQATQQLAKELGVMVTFTGKLTKTEWTDLAADYNVFINTTNFDNMPVSVIEAMALGLPVISTDVGGMPFLIDQGEDGLLVSSNDADAFVVAILKLCTEPDLKNKLVFNARKKVEQFDWEVVKHSWVGVLDDCSK